jgi:dephospho-CoA kinase
MKNRLVIGISGFVGSGKTTVGDILRKFGADFIDADKVVNEIYMPGSTGWSKIAGFLGDDFLKKDGNINRKKLAKFIFGDRHKLRIVNNLIHPLVTAEIRKKIAESRKKVIVIEASYFEKKNLLDIVDKIIWVRCDKEIAKKRVTGIKKFNGEMFDKIWKSQIKPERIDIIINNNTGRRDLMKSLKHTWDSLEKLRK